MVLVGRSHGAYAECEVAWWDCRRTRPAGRERKRKLCLLRFLNCDFGNRFGLGKIKAPKLNFPIFFRPIRRRASLSSAGEARKAIRFVQNAFERSRIIPQTNKLHVAMDGKLPRAIFRLSKTTKRCIMPLRAHSSAGRAFA